MSNNEQPICGLSQALRQQVAELPLTCNQQGLWFLHEMQQGNTAYNMVSAITHDDVLEVDILQEVFEEIISRHQILRTSFHQRDGHPYMMVHPDVEWTLDYIDLQALSYDARETQLKQLMAQHAAHVFDLTQPQLFIVQLVQCEPQEFVLILSMHHIISDGWSLEVLGQEITDLYQVLEQGGHSSLPQLTLQYGDYALWQKAWLDSADFDHCLKFWQHYLADATPLQLPFDQKKTDDSYRGASVRFSIDSKVSAAIKQLALEQGCSLFSVFIAVYGILLARLSNQQDIVISSAVADRPEQALEHLIGYFVNNVVFRLDLSQNLPFKQYLQQVVSNVLNVLAHKQMPFLQLAKELQLDRMTGQSVLVQAMLVFHSANPLFSGQAEQSDEQESNDSATARPASEVMAAKYDLLLDIMDCGSSFECRLEYNSDCYQSATILRYVDYFQTLLEASVLTFAKQPIYQLNMISPQEQAQLLSIGHYDPNQAATVGVNSWLDLWRQQVVRHGDKIAICWLEHSRSYRQLDLNSNRMAHYLLASGVKKGDFVALCQSRAITTIEWLLAVIKVGAAYVAIDPSYPPKRVADMLDDCQAKLLLSERKHQALLDCVATIGAMTAQKVWVDELSLSALSEQAPNVEILPQDLIYLLYTSGSTGRPKGVMVAHQNVLALVNWAYQVYHGEVLEGVVAGTSLSFDLSVFELFVPLGAGGRVLLLDSLLDIASIADQSSIKLINSVPCALKTLLEQQLLPASVQTVNLAGEPLSTQLVDQLYQQGIDKVYDLYGPTEDTTYSTYCLRQPNGPQTIGLPIAQTQAYILNPWLQLVPQGGVGELYLAGAGLSQGYLNQPELTERQFIDNVFAAPNSGEKLYKTGDLVRLNQNHQLQYLGRIDEQVKIRGFRIELADIEAALRQIDGIVDGIVIVVHRSERQPELVAFYLEADQGLLAPKALTAVSLRQQLSTHLPSYMLPSYYQALSEFPLTANGKVDKKALAKRFVRPNDDIAQAPAQNELQQQLCDIWSQALDMPVNNIDSDFFALGGHSLMAVQIIAKIRNTLGKSISLLNLFEAKTIRQLALDIEQSDDLPQSTMPVVIKPAPKDQPLPLSYAQQRLWFMERLGGLGGAFNMPFGIKIHGPMNAKALDLAMSEVIERHHSLRTVFVEQGDCVYQQVLDNPGFSFELIDLSACAQQSEQLAELIIAQASLSFDLSADLMVRGQVIKLQADLHVVLLTMHHIASDGWSLPILQQELTSLYQAYSHGQPSPLPPLEIQYGDFAAWQKQWLNSPDFQLSVDYWLQQLAQLPATHALALDHHRPLQQSYRGAHYRVTLDGQLQQQARDFAQAHGVTLFMLLQSVFATLLARLSGSSDIVMGTPIANREHQQLAPLIGFFVNMLVLRSEVQLDQSFSELLQRNRKMCLAAFEHQSVPFDLVVEKLQGQRDLSYHPLFQIKFVLQNNADVDFGNSDSADGTGVGAELINTQDQHSRFDLGVDIYETEQALVMNWEFCLDLFDQATISRMAANYQTLLADILTAPDKALHQFELQSEQESQKLEQLWTEQSDAAALINQLSKTPQDSDNQDEPREVFKL